MIASWVRTIREYPNGKGGNVLMLYDGKLTRTMYRLIISNAKEELSAFVKYVCDLGGRIGFVLAGHIIENSEAKTAAARYSIVDKTSVLLTACKREGLIDTDEMTWDIWGIWLPSESAKND